MRVFSYRIFSVVCLFSSLAPAAHCIQVRGINISQVSTPDNSSPRQQHAEDADNNHLDKMLEGYVFLTSSINTEVEIILPENDDSTQSSESELTDTDVESIDATNPTEAGGVDFVKFALNATLYHKNLKWNYLKREDVAAGESPESFSKNLCSKLSKDAFRIANAHKNARTRESTTCLCVVLRNEKQYAKKFVFHNGAEKMHESMNEKAVALKYAVRTGYQAHAEVEFIEFLLHRSKQDPERYTHILGMGCSRQHCKECNCLLKLYLGNNYHKFTAAMHMTESPQLPIITDCQEDGLHMRIEANYKLTHREEAISNGSNSNKYYLPKALQENIKNKTGLYIDFSNDRFTIKDEDKAVERRDRKRKASISVPQTDPK
jgi:hypothetical protein